MPWGRRAARAVRRWGYDVKKIPADQAVVIHAAGNFWGRTIAAVSASTDPVARARFGPFLPGYRAVPYDDLPALRDALADPYVAGFMARAQPCCASEGGRSAA